MYVTNSSNTGAPTLSAAVGVNSQQTPILYDMNSGADDPAQHQQLHGYNQIQKKLLSMCFGCGCEINDQFILRVAPDLEWHAKCLKCAECGQFLDESCTCFVRNGKTYCKSDYIRLFSKKCFKCNEAFQKNDFVMRVSQRIYHIDCFRCCMCAKQLAQGDEFALKDDGLLCKLDNEIFENHMLKTAPQPTQQQQQNHTSILGNNSSCQNITNLQNINPNSNQQQLPIKYDLQQQQQHPIKNEFSEENHNQNHHQSQQHIMSQQFSQQMPPGNQQQQQQQQNSLSLNMTNSNSNSSSSSTSSDGLMHGSHAGLASGTAGSSVVSNPGATSGSVSHRKDKTTRVRTVLNEKQLHTLRTCYGANPRPDALMKEQLVEMTGLSPRVIRVWFQNKRCKDKKKTILLKQMQEQQKNRQQISHGIGMIASSPMRNDISNLQGGQQIEMQHTSQAYASMSAWGMSDNGTGSGGMVHNQLSAYDQQLISGFASDEEDCFDQLSDAGGGDDSVSSVGLEDSRIQQL